MRWVELRVICSEGKNYVALATFNQQHWFRASQMYNGKGLLLRVWRRRQAHRNPECFRELFCETHVQRYCIVCVYPFVRISGKIVPFWSSGVHINNAFTNRQRQARTIAQINASIQEKKPMASAKHRTDRSKDSREETNGKRKRQPRHAAFPFATTVSHLMVTGSESEVPRVERVARKRTALGWQNVQHQITTIIGTARTMLEMRARFENLAFAC
jgi:hypothetical protein